MQPYTDTAGESSCCFSCLISVPGGLNTFHDNPLRILSSMFLFYSGDNVVLSPLAAFFIYQRQFSCKSIHTLQVSK